MGATKVRHNHGSSIATRAAAQIATFASSASSKIKNVGRKKGGEGAAEGLEEQEKWDEDDVMLYFWGNSKAALERHAQKEQERTEYLEDWRAGVTGNPDIV
jgi:hypothetical protein